MVQCRPYNRTKPIKAKGASREKNRMRSEKGPRKQEQRWRLRRKYQGQSLDDGRGMRVGREEKGEFGGGRFVGEKRVIFIRRRGVDRTKIRYDRARMASQLQGVSGVAYHGVAVRYCIGLQYVKYCLDYEYAVITFIVYLIYVQ